MELINQNFDNQSYYFYKIPKILFTKKYKKLSSNAKFCYMFLLDRINLSLYNNMIDEYGNVYIYYSRKDMERSLGLSKCTVISAFKQLVQFGLIKQVETDIGYRIYLYNIFNNTI